MAVKEIQLPEIPRQRTLLFALVTALLGIVSGILIVLFNNPIYILVGLAAMIGFVAAIGSVEFGLLLLVFITYTRFSDIAVHTYNAPSIAKSFIVILLIAIFIRWAMSNERPTSATVLPMILIAAYGLVGFTSLLYAPVRDAVVSSLSDFIKDALIALVVVVLLKKPQQFRHVIYTLLVIGIFIGSISVHQYLTRNFSSTYGGFATAEFMNIVGNTNDFRLSGPVGDPNFFAQVMVVLAILGAERLLHDKSPFWKLLAGWAAAVSTLTVIFTFSRGATIALVVAFIMFFWIYRLKPSQLIIVLTLGIVIVLFAPSSYYERVLTLQDILPNSSGEINVRDDRAIQGRASENLTAWRMLAENPLLGVGLNNFPYLYQEYTKTLGLAPSATQRSPHNLYLEVAAETGILGLSIFLLLIGFALRSVFTARRRFMAAGRDDYANLTTGFAIAFIGYLLSALFVHAAYPRYFYLLIGISYALPYLIDAGGTEPEEVIR
jgi:putative inorganic carbon (hco3(-)) transporter